jgi:signal peptidase II
MFTKIYQRGLSPSHFLLPFFAFLLIIGADRWSKEWVLSWPLDQVLRIMPLVDFVLVKNRGIAFGFFSEANLNFILLSIISLVMLFIIFFLYLPDFPIWSFALIGAGAIGNIIDRITYGFVVDFIKIHQFYVFNIADASITIGSILLILQFVIRKDTRDNACS